MGTQRSTKAYVDITDSGVTVSVLGADPGTVERVLREGAGAAPLSSVTQVYKSGGYTTGSVVVPDGDSASVKDLIEEALLLIGYEV